MDFLLVAGFTRAQTNNYDEDFGLTFKITFEADWVSPVVHL
jgi:hypothetical protein